MPRKTFETLSESLTPNEIKNKEFKRVPLGYSPQPVVEFLDTVSKTWERVQKREKELLEEIRLLNDEVEAWKKRETDLEAVRLRALGEAEAIREEGREAAARYFQEAKVRSDEIRGKTEEWLTTIIGQVSETERRRNSFLTALKSALDQHYELLNTDLEKNRGLESQLSGFLSSMSNQPDLPESAREPGTSLI